MDIKTILTYLSKHHCKLNKKEQKKEAGIIKDPNCEEYYYQKNYQHIEILVFISNKNMDFKIELIMNDLYQNNYLLNLSDLDGIHNAEFYIKTLDDLNAVIECINRCKKVIKIILKTENKIKKVING
jgi:hypothetical protein